MDLVYRQAAIAAIKTWGLIDGLSEGQAIEILADEEKLPSAQRWIPFMAEKPKGGQQILACSEDGVMWMTAYSALNNLTGAWMPLPEPWKGEDDERA